MPTPPLHSLVALVLTLALAGCGAERRGLALVPERYDVECTAAACTVASSHLGVTVTRSDGRLTLMPLHLVADFTGQPWLQRNGVVARQTPNQISIIPDFYRPPPPARINGHLLVGPGPLVVHWSGDSDTVERISGEAFLDVLRRSQRFTATTTIVFGGDMVEAVGRDFRTAPFVAAVEQAAARLDSTATAPLEKGD